MEYKEQRTTPEHREYLWELETRGFGPQLRLLGGPRTQWRRAGGRYTAHPQTGSWPAKPIAGRNHYMVHS